MNVSAWSEGLIPEREVYVYIHISKDILYIYLGLKPVDTERVRLVSMVRWIDSLKKLLPTIHKLTFLSIKVESQLVLNVSAWSEGLIPERDNANYTCASSNNTIGPGVASFTYFR